MQIKLNNAVGQELEAGWIRRIRHKPQALFLLAQKDFPFVDSRFVWDNAYGLNKKNFGVL